MRWNHPCLPRVQGAWALFFCLAALGHAGPGAAAERAPGPADPAASAASPVGPVLLEAIHFPGPIALDPGHPAWQKAAEQTIPLVQFLDSAGTETAPSSEAVKVKAVHNGQEIFFLLTWADPTRDDDGAETNRFADAAAIQVPGSGKILCMGSPKSPANVLFWRANLPKPQNLTAAGTGTPQVTGEPGSQNLRAVQSWRTGAWTVVLSRPMAAAGGQVAFERGREYPIAFAKWNGSNAERDGRKSYTDWHTLVIR